MTYITLAYSAKYKRINIAHFLYEFRKKNFKKTKTTLDLHLIIWKHKN